MSDYKHQLLLLLSLCFVLSAVHLHAQKRYKPDKWVGIHNMNFKNSSNTHIEEGVYSDGTPYTDTEDKYHKLFSFGLHYRLVQPSGLYHHFDIIAFDREEHDEILIRSVQDVPFPVPTRGFNLKTHQVVVGYQIGKLIPVTDHLTADVGLRGSARYFRQNRIPANNFSFPITENILGLSINAELGLNYKLGDHFVLGYHIMPAAIDFYLQDVYIARPTLPERMRTTREFAVGTRFAENVLSFNNISLSYIFEGKEQKKLKKRRRKRRK